jgi:hypothetical protein
LFSTFLPERREREKRKRGVSERNCVWGREQEAASPVFKVPRQCPLFLLLQVMHMIGIDVFYMTLDISSAFSLGLSEATETLNRSVRSQDLRNAN